MTAASSAGTAGRPDEPASAAPGADVDGDLDVDRDRDLDVDGPGGLADDPRHGARWPAVPRPRAGESGRGRRRPAGSVRRDLGWAGGVAAALIVVAVVLRTYLGRAFWYDEIWRGHFVSEPADTFWSELSRANTPSAAGWVAVERLGGELLGWHAWVLRLPGFVALPLLGAGVTLLVARFAGRPAAVFAAGWICLNSTFLDLGTQLKPYTIEALAAVVAVGLWLWGERGVAGGVRGHAEDQTGGEAFSGTKPPFTVTKHVPTVVGEEMVVDRKDDHDLAVAAADGDRLGGVSRGRLARRTAAGLVGLFSVPAVFLLAPLAVADVLSGALGARRAGARPAGMAAAGARRAIEALPALVLVGAHTLFFVGHQSSQRLGTYWDAHFLAGRGPGEALVFVGEQLRDLVTGTPPGIDRYDPSLLHAPTDGTWVSLWLFAPAVVVCGLAGVAILARRHDGRLVLAALGGAQLTMLAASAVRFWPFGPTRTNLFVVPLIVLVVVTGAADLLGRLGRLARGALAGFGKPGALTDSAAAPAGTRAPAEARAPRLGVAAPAVLLAIALSAVGIGAQAASAARDGRLYDQRDRLRGLDFTVDATIAARRLYREGDLVVVGGRLMRPGWLYAMEASDDAARRPGALPPATGQAPRVPRSATVFFSKLGEGEVARAVAARAPAPRRLLMFVFDQDIAATRPDVADLRRAGWCPAETYAFPLTGTLTVLAACR
ncbi:hypothetical protein I6A84_36945 [Frankia sp. CNm7]|uniref:Uncharacterized protein n=1 Tax=Frankia nepalensis TaxID=1836974 RepID=A0A937URB3_9ACTN|nr:hypothetical protein [Frankia nepalensis]MBL7496745.1 hypothetical protein [Frankia nepalensis]MBL7510433.1 hypothetical protein [Frankia nepalensis]MBL7523490.1 hypothetical protein [Frankia nepalensis]MBL7630973.1 hypothetical protein [Frankia nepalensis]